ncbi:MAG: hypothetical protein ABIH71_07685 [Candidatus Omnitrophota bacterium]
MKKLKLVFLIMLLGMCAAGCASLKKAMFDVTPEQQAQVQPGVSVAVTPFIPQPYQIPATALAGWLACVGFNWFKEKTKPKV